VRTLSVIGIGAGDPEYLTLQAIRAIGAADVFFLLSKGEEKDSLVRFRTEVLAAYARPGHRVAQGRDPDRDRTPADYVGTVADWRHRRALVTEDLIREHLGEDEHGAFLVWGDPTLYDSTIGILEDILARGGTAFDYTVIPGISSVSALAAKHRTPLSGVGRAVQITTGRRLAAGWPDGVDDVVVMLDAQQAFHGYAEPGVDIFWGAYVGTPEEELAAGPLDDVAGRIGEVRAAARRRHGWIMDTYLLRRRTGAGEQGNGGDRGEPRPGGRP
jgi:precorrin-6A synthase